LIVVTAAVVLYFVYTSFISTGSDEGTATETMPETTASVDSPTETVALELPQRPETGATATPKEPFLVLNLRHPKTGEMAPFPNTYRFAKKWVKEMMVAEGLLDRVYKSAELEDNTINQKVKAAIERLKTLEQYHA
jgi:hypothetical protein